MMKNLFILKELSIVKKSIMSLLVFGILCTGCLDTTTEIPITMSLSSTSLSFIENGGEQSFTVNSNTNNWTVSSNTSWITISSSASSNNGNVTVKTTINTETSQRTGTITIRGTGVTPQNINVTQSGQALSLKVDPSSLSFSSSGEQKTFDITSNTNWTISRGAAMWFTVSPESGSNNSKVTINAMANTVASTRTGTITISGTGVTPQSINVTQAEAIAPPQNVFGNGIIAASNFGGGSGTQNSPYLINNANQLKKLVNDVNNGINYANTFFRLMTDIQVTADEWIPIANRSPVLFSGNFDGNNHIINGTLKSNNNSFFGFFGRLDGGSQIANLTIAAAVINEENSSSVEETGAIAGQSYGNAMIDNCHVTGSVKGGNGKDSWTGGILGYGGRAVIINCSVSSQIKGGNAVGSMSTSITGGIVGYFAVEITNCTVLVSAKVTGGEAELYNETGGIAGTLYNSSQVVKITNCTNHAAVTGNYRVGGLIGSFDHGTIHTSLNTGNVSGRSGSTGGLVGKNGVLSETQTFVYSCCTNRGTVNGATASSNNQIGNGKAVVTCPNGHTKR